MHFHWGCLCNILSEESCLFLLGSSPSGICLPYYSFGFISHCFGDSPYSLCVPLQFFWCCTKLIGLTCSHVASTHPTCTTYSGQVKQKPVPWVVPWKAIMLHECSTLLFPFWRRSHSEEFWLCHAVLGGVWGMVGKWNRLFYPVQHISSWPHYYLGSYTSWLVSGSLTKEI